MSEIRSRTDRLRRRDMTASDHLRAVSAAFHGRECIVRIGGIYCRFPDILDTIRANLDVLLVGGAAAWDLERQRLVTTRAPEQTADDPSELCKLPEEQPG